MRTALKRLILMRGGAPSTLLNDLYAYWTMDETGASSRQDSIGNSHAAVNGTVSAVTGKMGNAANFNGSLSNFLEVTHNDAINPAGTAWTVAFWVRFNAFGSAGIMSKVGVGNQFLIDQAFSGSFHIVRNITYGSSAGIATLTTSVSGLDTTNFYPVRAWYNGTTQIGIQLGTDTPATATVSAGGVNVSSTPLRFGYWDGAARPANCALDGVGFWKRLLTDAEWTEFQLARPYPF